MKKQKFMLKIMWMLMIVFVIGVVPCGLEAKASIVDSGTCGAEGNEENVTWTVDSGERILTVSGQGAIKDYADFYSGMKAPWHQYRRKIDKIVIEEGITCIGECAFGEMLETELVLPTSSLKEIKSGAFMWNSNLREIDLPETITVLGGGVFSRL